LHTNALFYKRADGLWALSEIDNPNKRRR